MKTRFKSFILNFKILFFILLLSLIYKVDLKDNSTAIYSNQHFLSLMGEPLEGFLDSESNTRTKSKLNAKIKPISSPNLPFIDFNYEFLDGNFVSQNLYLISLSFLIFTRFVRFNKIMIYLFMSNTSPPVENTNL